MNKVVYVVGTRHRFQGWRNLFHPTPKHQLNEFKILLQKAIHDYSIRSVAEEMNIEHLDKYRRLDLPPHKSVAYLAAEELNLPHCYCDPNAARRKELGITDKDEDEAENDKKREAEWLTQLANFASFPCLFVLGSKHSASFCDLLKTSGFKAILLEEEWWPINSM